MKKTDVLVKTLQELGLSEGEARVYMAIAGLGMAHVAAISKESGVKRSTVYEYLERLLLANYIRKTIKGRRLYYFAEDPERIIASFEKKKRSAEAVLPQLKELYRRSARKPVVRFYEGKEGLRQVYREMTDSPKRLWSVFSADRYYEVFSEKDGIEFLDTICKAGGRSCALVENTPEGRAYVKEARGGDVEKAKLLPPGMALGTDMMVSGHKVAMISFENLVAFIIESEDSARLQEQMMRFMWSRMKG
mgnify:CR=1 FL=1